MEPTAMTWDDITGYLLTLLAFIVPFSFLWLLGLWQKQPNQRPPTPPKRDPGDDGWRV
jgi:hypothetical protein